MYFVIFVLPPPPSSSLSPPSLSSLGSRRASRHDEAGHPSQEPLAREGGDRGDGGGRQAHQLEAKCHD